ncbi:hypothetical protein LN042_13285 [Kitasatospora sp. RB6PN24]|uniref:LppU/SCO3897 family protein n=1 Tax=Kitasatospora humi TaxID=2893891 RepID=UPI001E5A818C|nr:hypothetical protein [Kitasatospora humi]MCC9308051.1 hypothetical protein [Kitasatospora humi]
MTQPQQPPNPYVPPPPTVPPAVPTPVPAQPNPWAAPAPATPYPAPPAPPQDAVPPAFPAPPTAAPQFGPPQPDHPYGSYPPPAPGYGYPQLLACRICGGIPAADVTVRGHQGLVVMMRFLSSRGPFCQVCGTSVVRDMSERTLWRGWWSYVSSLFTLIALLRNRSAYQRLRRLPAPQPGTHGPQLDPGRPLTKRAAIWMLLLPVVAVVLAVVLPLVLAASAADGSTDTGADVVTVQAGDCIHDANGSGGSDDANASVTVVPCSGSLADYKVVARVASLGDEPSQDCRPYSNATHWFVHHDAARSFVLCLASPQSADSGGSSGGGSGSGSGSSVSEQT